MMNADFQRGAVRSSECVSNAWEMIKLRYWMYVGIAFLAFIFSSYFYCISWAILGPTLAGVYFVALRDMRGEPVDFGMMFKGFEKFVPLMTVGLIQAVPDIIGAILGFVLNIGQLFVTGLDGGRNRDFFAPSDPNFAVFGGLAFLILLVAVGFLLFSIIWRLIFFSALPLVLEYDIPPFEAIKLSARASFANAGGLISLVIFEGLIIILGFVLICFGLIFISLPIIYVANAFAYRQIFPYIGGGDGRNMSPPPPASYGSNFGQGF
jgi:uncharacterized membrane protein